MTSKGPSKQWKHLSNQFSKQKSTHNPLIRKQKRNARSVASLTSRGNPPLYRIHNSIRYRSSQLDHKSLAWVPGYHTSRCNILITSTRSLLQKPQKRSRSLATRPRCQNFRNSATRQEFCEILSGCGELEGFLQAIDVVGGELE
jgi:hypothetical protein